MERNQVLSHISVNKQMTVGRYVLAEVLGQGAFGPVYLAYHSDTKEYVVIKKIEKVSSPDKAKAMKLKEEAFRKEIKFRLGLHHPNIVQLIGFITENENYYLLTEYCQYGDLKKFIHAKFPNRRVPELQAQKIFQDIISGVKLLHKNQIIHRNLKLENILIDRNHRAKIDDFTFGQMLNQEKQSFTSLVTDASPFVAPEIEKQGHTTKSEVWALGIILYQMLYGDSPFRHLFLIRREILKCFDNPKWLTFPKDVEVSESAKELLSLILQADPEKRIDSQDLFKHKWVTESNTSIDLRKSMLDEDEEQPSPELGIFEKFYIIGATDEEIEKAQQKNPKLEKIELQPRVLWSYYPSGIVENKLLNEQEEQIPLFCYLSGFEAVKQKMNFMEMVGKILKNTPENTCSFVFKLQPSYPPNQNLMDSEFIKETNFEVAPYHYAIKFTDYSEFNYDRKKDTVKFWQSSKTIVFRTYYPLAPLFFKVLDDIREFKRIQVIGVVQRIQTMSVKELQNTISEERMILESIKPLLKPLFETPSPRFSSFYKVIGDTTNSFSLQICDKNEAVTVEGDWICCPVFSYFPRNDLVHLLSAFLLERQIVIISSNFGLLTATLYAIQILSKPFSGNRVSLLNHEQLGYLDAPCGFAFGLEMDINRFFSEELPSKYPQVQFYVLDNYRIYTTRENYDFPEIEESSVRKVFKPDYDVLNKNPGTIIECIPSSKFLQTEHKGEKNLFISIIYRPNADQRKACVNVIYTLYHMLRNYILELLPEKPIREEISNELNYEKLKLYASEIASSEDNFFKEFKETQMFTYFLETHYARVGSVEEEKVIEEAELVEPVEELIRAPKAKAKKADYEAKYEISQLQYQRTQSFLKNVLAKYQELELKEAQRNLDQSRRF